MNIRYLVIMVAATLMNAEFYAHAEHPEDPGSIVRKAQAIELRFQGFNDSGKYDQASLSVRKTYFINAPDAVSRIVELVTVKPDSMEVIGPSSGAVLMACQVVCYEDYLGTKLSTPTLTLSKVDHKFLQRLFDLCDAETHHQ